MVVESPGWTVDGSAEQLTVGGWKAVTFHPLGAMYDDGLDGVPDDEIRRLINWGIARNPGPATRRRGGGQAVDLRWHGKPLGSRIAKGEEAIANVKKRLAGFVCRRSIPMGRLANPTG